MQIVITGKNVNLSGSLKDYVEKKVTRLEKYLTEPIMAQVVLATEKFRSMVDLTVSAKEGTFHVSEEMDDMYAAIDRVVDVMEERLRRKKEKVRGIPKGRNTKEHEVVSNIAFGAGSDEVKIVEEVIDSKPMSVEEAILQLDKNEKNFVVFVNIDTGKVNVIYKKKEGVYGLIVT